MKPETAQLILALDVSSFDEVRSLVSELKDVVDVFKIGSQLFTRCGPQVIDLVHRENGQVFLDLKYHDIPNTVASAVREACRQGVYMLDVHTMGGRRMMQHVMQVVGEIPKNPPLVFGITVLTSMAQEDLEEINIHYPLADQVVRLARLAKDHGLSGVVASAHEVQMIKEECGQDFLIITPGVRFPTDAVQDQKRIVTPEEAVRNGANFIVVGRPILEAKDRARAARKIRESMQSANI